MSLFVMVPFYFADFVVEIVLPSAARVSGLPDFGHQAGHVNPCLFKVGS